MGLATGMLVLSAIVLTPVVLLIHQFYGFHWPLTIPDWLILLEVVLSTTGYVIFFTLIKLAGPVYYSLVSGVVALTSLFWGWLIFHEGLNAITILAVIFILLAIVTMTVVSPKTAPKNDTGA